MQQLKAFLNFCSKHYLMLMAAITPVIIWLNIDALGMHGLLGDYQTYKAVIISGFDSALQPTFPMWGYGWILLITEQITAVLFIQSALALGALFLIIRVIERQQILTRTWLKAVKVALIIALPWYALHALRWANSFSVSFFLIALAALLTALENKKWNWFLLSGIAFGVALNFRSEFYLMPVGFFVLIAIFYRDSKKYLHLALWFASIYVMLIPWGIYTKHITGKFLITSTNSGHVCFIGLGNNPNNKWGIVEHDNDTVMRALLDQEFDSSTTSLEYKADTFLKKEFMRKVRQDPQEYVKKCLWSTKRFFTQGVYPGEFIDWKQFMGKQKAQLNFTDESTTSLVASKRSKSSYLRFFLQLYSDLFGKLLVALSLIFLPITAYHAIRRKNLAFILFSAIICYQAAVNILCYQMSSYTSNLILFLILNLIYFIQVVVAYRNGKKDPHQKS